MRQIHDQPLFARTIDNETLHLKHDITILFESSIEERSLTHSQPPAGNPHPNLIRLDSSVSSMLTTHAPTAQTLSLRNRSDLAGFLSQFDGMPTYIDITGMPHDTWAPLTKVGLELKLDLKIIYFEPDTYKQSDAPRDGEIFDLSEKIEGIKPIPQFSTLTEDDSTSSIFVPLLGFEGNRFAYVNEHVQPNQSLIYPIIGSPGFKPEYTFYSYLGNARALEQSGAFANVRHAKSSCPFSLAYTVREIAADFPGHQIKIGMMGTKPHALGAVLFAIARPDIVELIYDQAKRKANRTTGTGICHIYDVSDFMLTFS
jgi:hypothetical protein